MTTVVSVAQGGTGSNNATAARSSLGAAPLAAYDAANNAYAAANTASSTGGGGYAQANAAYDKANAAVTVGENAYSQANAAYVQANGAYAQANGAYGQANLAYTAANNSNLLSGGLITGTLNVTQDVIVGGNIYLGGNTTFINVSTYSIEDSLIYLAANNTLTDSVDIGFVGAKNSSGTFAHTGLARDATDGKYKLFDNLADSGHVGNIIDFANSTIATLVANVEANSITLVGNTVATQANLTLAHNQANTARTTANDAYGAANNSVLKAGDTMTGNLTVTLASPMIRLEESGSGGSKRIELKVNSSGVGFISADQSSQELAFTTVGTERLRITSSGNVGIGTTNPSAKLHVASSSFQDHLILERTGIGLMHITATNPRGLQITDGSTTFLSVLQSSGNVGIGTNNPSTKLDVWGDDGGNGSVRLVTKTSGTGSYQQIWRVSNTGSTVNDAIMTLYSNDVAKISMAANAARGGQVYFNAGGNVGIGTTSNETARLEVREDGITAAAISTGWPHYGAESAAQSKYLLDLQAGGNGSVATGGQGPSATIIMGGYFDSRGIITMRGAGGASPSDQGTGYGKDLMVKAGNSDNGNGFVGGRLFLAGGSGYSGGAFGSNYGSIIMQSQGGNVGIGTTSPYSQLHLTGDVTMGSGSNARPAFKITNWGYSAGYRALLIGSTSTNYTTANTGAVTIAFNYDPSVNGNGSFTGDGSEIIFRRGTKFITPSSDNTLFNLTNLVLLDGNVGIGTTNPAAKLDVDGNIFPSTDNTRDLGSSSKRWANIYTADLNLSNRDSSNDIDGTWGDWTIQEGEDNLYVINNRNGKKFKIKLEEV